jgi:hypothetical protein
MRGFLTGGSYPNMHNHCLKFWKRLFSAPGPRRLGGFSPTVHAVHEGLSCEKRSRSLNEGIIVKISRTLLPLTA